MSSASFAPIKNPQKEEYIAVCTTVKKAIKIHVIGCKSKAAITDYTVAPDNIRAFLDGISTMFDSKKCKAIIFDIYKFKPADHECPHVINFCYQIRAKLDEMQIKHFFYADRSIFLSGLLISSKINSSKGDTVLFLLVKDDSILVLEYIYTDLGHQKIRKDTITVPAEAESWVEIRGKILAGSKPKNIIVFGVDMDLPIMKTLKKNIFVKEKLFFIGKKTLSSESVQHSLIISKYVQDHGYTKFHVIPTCAKKYRVHCVDSLSHPFLAIEVGTQLLYKFEDYVPRSCNAFCITGFDENGENEKLIYETVQEENDRHRSKITVVVDPESFPLLIIRPIIIDLIHELPAHLDKNHAEKIPVIVFCDNFSVICVYKDDEKKHHFLDGWNGEWGQSLCISFDEEKPKFGQKAFEMVTTKPTFVISDLIKIMSIPAEEIEQDQSWSFTVTKDSENPVLLQFDNFDGTKTAASPAFLMALLLKEHLKFIKIEIGKKAKKIAIYSLDYFNTAEKNRVENGLKDACKLLNIDCCFLKTDPL
uniref:Uncharacterized protein n=1 Tax=Panagrolaimus sp. ES5 TaxID=591445 RepID=A0AC34FYN0_9BILA